MAEEAPNVERASLASLVRGAEKTFENAEQLFHEAKLLAASGAVARALALHQISLEECSKVDTLGAWAVSQLLGFAVDQKKVLAAMRRHPAKNKGNAYMLALSQEEVEARSRGDWRAASDAFRETQEEFHASANRAKNGALYVDWEETGFVAPVDRITAEMLADITRRNAEFLGYAYNNIRTLQRLEGQPDAMRDLLTDFVEQAEKLREEKPDNLMHAFEALMLSFFEEGKTKLLRRSGEQVNHGSNERT